MKVNNAAGVVTNELLQAMGQNAFIGKNAASTRELRRKREREALRKRRVIATSIPQGKGFQ